MGEEGGGGRRGERRGGGEEGGGVRVGGGLHPRKRLKTKETLLYYARLLGSHTLSKISSLRYETSRHGRSSRLSSTMMIRAAVFCFYVSHLHGPIKQGRSVEIKKK